MFLLKPEFSDESGSPPLKEFREVKLNCYFRTDREYTYFVPPESGYQDNIFYLVFPEKTPSTVPEDSKASVEEKTGNFNHIFKCLYNYFKYNNL